jgi:beta-N-acetylhexosaminidase
MKTGRAAATIVGAVVLLDACSFAGAERSSRSATTTTAAPSTTMVVTTTTVAEPAMCRESPSWSVRRKLAQLVMVGVDGESAEQVAAVLARPDPVGGVFVLGDAASLLAGGDLGRRLDELDPRPLLAVDEEGGRVQRLEGLLGELPSAREQAAARSPEQVRALARGHGERLRGLGIDIDLAPVVDVSAQPGREVIGDRSYGSSPDAVITYAGAFAAGLRAAGILPTLKHFPGHGRAVGDSHQEMARAPTLGELEQVDLVPYRALLDEGAAAVMVGHLDVPGLTAAGVPASLSPAAYALLRDRFGFDGLALTDEVGAMAAVSARYGAPEAVRLALTAGADLALVTDPANLDPILTALEAAGADGSLPTQRIEDALTRVLRAKGCR